MSSKFMREKTLKMRKRPGTKQRFAIDRVVTTKPRDASKNSYLPRVDGMMVRRYKRTSGCVMSFAAREALQVHLEKPEAFFMAISAERE